MNDYPLMTFANPPRAGECYQTEDVDFNGGPRNANTIYVQRVGTDRDGRKLVWLRDVNGKQWAAEYTLEAR